VTVPALLSVLALGLVACGDDEEGASTAGTAPAGSGADATAPVDSVTDVSLVPATAPDESGKPAVSIPAELPTELVVTELVPGSGAGAADGDTVIVDYVGVRSEDGTEFDSSYGRGAFPVTLGAGQVIQGWEQGLVGATAGSRVQLDIPAELAYGDQDTGDVIKAGDALTFVIDVRAVLPKVDPADAPIDVDVEPSVGATELTITDLVVGDGPVAEADSTAAVNLILARGDNEVVVENTWESGQPLVVSLAQGQIPPGLVEAIEGMRVGGRRVATIPAADAFGEQGIPQLGLPANTDIIVVIDLVGAF
jgi:peptidylprolyl isomerase